MAAENDAPTGGGACELSDGTTASWAMLDGHGGALGRVASWSAEWRADAGVYELSYVPASRGDFFVHLVCVREDADGNVVQRAVMRHFFPHALRVLPLQPDPSTSRLANALRWHGKQLAAGTRLHLVINLRDTYGNACSWVGYDYDDDEGEGVASGGSATPTHSEPLDLQGTIMMTGVALTNAEAKPHALQIGARDEAIACARTRAPTRADVPLRAWARVRLTRL